MVSSYVVLCLQNIRNPLTGMAVAIGIACLAHSIILCLVRQQTTEFLVNSFLFRTNQLQCTCGNTSTSGVD